MLNRLHVILSAEKAGQSEVESAQRTSALRADLKNSFYSRFDEVDGFYMGTSERAFIVQCKDHAEVGLLFKWAKDNGQDCIMLVDPECIGFLLHANLKMERLGPVIASEWLPEGLQSYTYNPVSQTYYYTL